MTDNIKQEIEKNAERLRQVLPLMSQHKIPATPENYAVWYHHVLGDEQQLQVRIGQLIEQQAKFTPEINEELFGLLNSSDQHLKMALIGEQLQTILKETTGAINSSGAQAQEYGESLQQLQSGIDTDQNPAMELLQAVLQETNQMRSSLQEMQQEFSHKTQEMDQLKVELEQVRHRATTDPLTGLANRTAFAEKLDALIIDATNNNSPLCMLMFDIDHFKKVNDTHGHIIGDKVIRFVAQTLNEHADKESLASRYGGEEFALLYPNADMEKAMQLAESIRKTVREAKLVRTGTREPIGQVTISGGVACYRDGFSPTEFIQHADEALYEAKHNGRDRIERSD